MFVFDLDELVKNAEEAKDLNSICFSIVEEANTETFDENQIRKNEDWSILAYQVVGSESR